MSFLEKATAIREREAKYPRRTGSKDVPYGTSVPEQERSGIDNLLYYIGLLLRYKWLIIGITFIAGVGVVFYAYRSLSLPPEESPMPNYYEAEAHLILNPQGATTTEMLLSSLGMDPQQGGAFSNTGQIAQIVLTSRKTLDQLIAGFNLDDTSQSPPLSKEKLRSMIRSSANISYDARTSSLWISYQSIDPVFARDVVQRMIEILDQWFADQGGSVRAQQRKLLEEKIAAVESEIESLETQIRRMQSEYKVLTIGELATAQSELLNDLRSQRAQKELEIRNYSELSRINDPRMALLRVELSNLSDLIDQIERGNYSSLPAQDQIPDLAAQFASLNSELELQQRILQTLTEQYEIIKLADVDERPFEILQAPEIPEQKAGPRRSELVMKVVGGAFAASVALALAIHWVRQIAEDPEKRKLLKQT